MFLKTLAILLISLPLAAQTVRPNLNGLELRKGRMIAAAQSDAQAEAAAATKQASEAQKAFANGKAGNMERLTRNLTEANARAKQSAIRVTQLQNQMNDWTQKTLHVHGADDGKHGIDWTHGAVVSK